MSRYSGHGRMVNPLVDLLVEKSAFLVTILYLCYQLLSQMHPDVLDISISWRSKSIKRLMFVHTFANRLCEYESVLCV